MDYARFENKLLDREVTMSLNSGSGQEANNKRRVDLPLRIRNPHPLSSFCETD